MGRNFKRVLLASELGGNLGHVGPLRRIAGEAATLGLNPVLAVPDLETAFTFALDVPVLQSPRWPAFIYEGAIAGDESFLDVLTFCGFAAPNHLSSVMRGWKSLIDLVKPDLVVADHAPALAYLAEALALPIVHHGTGFTLPAIVNGRFQPLRSNSSPLVPERRLLGQVQQALQDLKLPVPDRLASAFERGTRLVNTVPELDPYAATRREPCVLPAEDLPPAIPIPEHISIFGYFDGAAPDLAAVLQSLAESGQALNLYIRNGSAFLKQFMTLRGHKVFEEPPSLSELLPSVSHVISHGGSFTAHACLFAGRPHLIWPLHDEARLNLAMLSRLGCAKPLPLGTNMAAKDEFLALLSNHDLLQAAWQMPEVLKTRNQQTSLAIVRKVFKGTAAAARQ